MDNSKKTPMSKSSRNILIAFFLNLIFAIVEVVGGILTNSVLIFSDAFHDFGDAASLGVSYFLERKSTKKPDNKYTYGYARYSIISALIMSIILIVGAILMTYISITRILQPEVPVVKAQWMIILAVIGIVVHIIAAIVTSRGENLNQRATFLHTLEDTMGWFIVLIGSILMLTIDNPNIYLLDPILTIGMSIFVFIGALRNLFKVFAVLLEKAPKDFPTNKFLAAIQAVDQVDNAHHLHVWTLTGQDKLATVHVNINSSLSLKEAGKIRENINKVAEEFEINHLTVQFETEHNECIDGDCDIGEHIHNDHHH